MKEGLWFTPRDQAQLRLYVIGSRLLKPKGELVERMVSQGVEDMC